MTAEISAEAFLRRLAERGIEYIFANAGTDFASIIEAIARNHNRAVKYPRAITVPHENVAMAMAHGYYRASGKPACVMVHVNVGTANTINGLFNAAKDNVPMLLASGRTPLTEKGSIASRNRSIHWGQEMFDQGGMVREIVKWDYEMRAGQSAGALVDRALDIAMSEPRGPVYLTLPRELLAENANAARVQAVHELGVPAPVPQAAEIDKAAAMIASASFPLIITSSAGRTPQGMKALAALAQDFAIPVVQNEARDLNLPTDHPMHLGFVAAPWLDKADCIVVIDCVMPWIPKTHGPKAGAKVIHLSADPLQQGYPYREMEADLMLGGETAAAMTMLHAALADRMKGKDTGARRATVTKAHDDMLAARKAQLDKARAQTPVHPLWLAHCVNEQKAKDAIIVSELGLAAGNLDLTSHGSFMGNLISGGLGFGLGAALGVKLVNKDREVIVSVGDGSYMFGNPLPFHYVANAEQLPVLTIVTNNHSWHAVRQSTLDVHPDGEAARANIMPLTELKPSPAFEKVIESCGGYGEKVEKPEDVPAALQRALAKVRSGTPALLNVVTQGR